MQVKFNLNVFVDCSLKYLPKKKITEKVNKTLRFEKIKKANISIILTDDKKITVLNKKYLKHDRPTDVIAFSLNDNTNEIEGEIYISVDTAKIQAAEYNVSLTNELMRLAVHGTLHLIGYEDDTIEKKTKMHNLEDGYIKD